MLYLWLLYSPHVYTSLGLLKYELPSPLAITNPVATDVLEDIINALLLHWSSIGSRQPVAFLLNRPLSSLCIHSLVHLLRYLPSLLDCLHECQVTSYHIPQWHYHMRRDPCQSAPFVISHIFLSISTCEYYSVPFPYPGAMCISVSVFEMLWLLFGLFLIGRLISFLLVLIMFCLLFSPWFHHTAPSCLYSHLFSPNCSV